MDRQGLSSFLLALEEASLILHKSVLLDVLASRLQKKVAAAFVKQANRFLVYFEDRFKGSNLFEASRILGDSLADLDFSFSQSELETLRLFEVPLNQAVLDAMASGSRNLLAELGVGIDFSLQNPRAVAYLEEHGAKLVTRINETTRNKIQSLVAAGAERGLSYSQIAKEIVAAYKEFAIGKPQLHIDGRAHLIAITEVGNAYKEGEYQVVRGALEVGVQMEKQWVTMGDNRVSEECLKNELDGWIPAEKEFSSGDLHPLRFPGCRCDIHYQIVKTPFSNFAKGT